MISYGLAKARAMAGRDDWNEREAIRNATILWYDTEDEGYQGYFCGGLELPEGYAEKLPQCTV